MFLKNEHRNDEYEMKELVEKTASKYIYLYVYMWVCIKRSWLKTATKEVSKKQKKRRKKYTYVCMYKCYVEFDGKTMSTKTHSLNNRQIKKVFYVFLIPTCNPYILNNELVGCSIQIYILVVVPQFQ